MVYRYDFLESRKYVTMVVCFARDSVKNNMAPSSIRGKIPPPFLDDSDCERPACNDMVANMKRAAEAANATKTETKTAKLQSRNSSSSNTTESCPPNTAELGRSGWTILHSMAAWYPDNPSRLEQTHMAQLIDSFARFYPCPWCAQDFQQNIQLSPVRTSTRTDLCQWMCEQHNRVNEKLGKKLFPCDMKTLDDRWRRSHREECLGRRVEH